MYHLVKMAIYHGKLFHYQRVDRWQVVLAVDFMVYGASKPLRKGLMLLWHHLSMKLGMTGLPEMTPRYYHSMC
jgi:hypothetical protein